LLQEKVSRTIRSIEASSENINAVHLKHSFYSSNRSF
jgi:hypothetical protein